ncbi:MAG: hypothetical protein HEP71_14750 [Roseivirga sp.]|nr:hypothetical protein [Roseivirga sp.]
MRFSTFFLAVLFVSGCRGELIDVDTIVQKAYTAHGGKAIWDSISELSYEKESVVYNADGGTRFQNLQRHHYVMRPQFSAQLEWQSNDEEHRIEYTHVGARKWIDDVEVMDSVIQASSSESVNAARYTVSQPFKLTDPGVILSYEGMDILEAGEQVYVIKASYSTDNENHTKSDEWWYYFDVDTYLCLATMVHHGSTYSYIKNLEYDYSTDIVFNYHRKGYAVDSTRKVLYHQSEYYYHDYKLSFSSN